MSSPKIEITKKRNGKLLVHISIFGAEGWEKEYQQETPINQLLNEYKSSTGNDFPSQILEDWLNQKNEENIKEQQLNNFVNKYEEGNLILGKNSLMIPEIIGKPFNDPFCVFAFYKSQKNLKVLKNENANILNGLEDYGPYSSYCNGNNILFISGGETKDKKLVEKFWKIDLSKSELSDIQFIKMIPKKNHSMIIVPGDYVFIVGGQDRETFYYDMKNSYDNFYGWKPLKNIRTEPALILVNNFLYCFDNLNSRQFTNDLTFEKTDLSLGNSEWELMHVNIPNIKFDQKFFGVVQKDDDILFLGGNIDTEEENKNRVNERKNFKYNITNNRIEETEIPFIEFNLKEKTFLPYNEKIYYIFPDFNKHHPEVIFYQKNKNMLKQVKYESLIEGNNNLQNGVNVLPSSKINHYNFNQPKPNENINIVIEKDISEKNVNDNINEQKKDIKISEPNLRSIDENLNKSESISIHGGERIIINEKNNDNKNNEISNNANNNDNNINTNIDSIPKKSIREEIENDNKLNEDNNTEQLQPLDKKLKYPNLEDKKEIEFSPFNLSQKQKIEEGQIKIENENTGNELDINNGQNKYDQINIDFQQPIKEKDSMHKEEKSRNSLINAEVKIEDKKLEKPEDIEVNPKVDVQIKIPEGKSEGKKKEGYGFYVSGIIYGVNNLNNKDANIKEEGNIKDKKENIIEINGNLKGNDAVLNQEIKGPIIESNINNKNDININAESKEKEKDFFLSGIIVGSKETNPKLLKLKKKENIPNVKIDESKEDKKVDINLNINEQKKIETNPESNINEGNAEVFHMIDTIKFKDNEINIEEIKLKDNKNIVPSAEINIENKVNIDENINLPNIEINNNPPGVNAPIPNIEIPQGKVEIKENISENITEKNPKTNIKFNSNIPEMKLTGTNSKTPIKLPEDEENNNVNIQPFNINVQKPNMDINPYAKKKDNNSPDFSLSGIIVGTKEPNYKKKNNLPIENKSEININGPKLDFNGNIINGNINAPKVEIKDSDQKELNINFDQKNENDQKKLDNNKAKSNKKEQKDFFYLSGVIHPDNKKDNKNMNIINHDKAELKMKENLEENKENQKASELNIQNSLKNNYDIAEEKGVKGNKKILPTVGIKSDNFVSSKVDEGGNLNEININFDNLKSANVGVNGQKNGNRIDS